MGCSRKAIAEDEDEFADFKAKYLPKGSYLNIEMPAMPTLKFEVYSPDYTLAQNLVRDDPALHGEDLVKLTLAHRYIDVVKASLTEKAKRYQEYLKLKKEFE